MKGDLFDDLFTDNIVVDLISLLPQMLHYSIKKLAGENSRVFTMLLIQLF